jgi:ion channel
MSYSMGTHLNRLWDAERGPFGLLSATVLTVFVISPLVVMGLLPPLIMDGFNIIVLLGGVLTVRPRPAIRYFMLFLAVMAVLTGTLLRIVPGFAISVIDASISVLAIGFFAALVMKQFLVAERPASHRIGAAIVVYLLVGFLWARFYEIAGLLIPGAFHMDSGNATVTSYLYFSYVTLATIGYGDISPVHTVVRNLAVLEAITGQLYLAILIARLVSASGQKGQ